MSLLDAALIGYGTVILTMLMDKFKITDCLQRLICEDSAGQNTDKVLTIGYSGLFLKRAITVDMGIDSHMLIIGLSNCGKSKLAEKCLQGKSVTVLNAFDEDFESLKGKRIVGNKNILGYLENCLKGRNTKSMAHYILIDEMLVLMKDKKIEKALTDLLATARHYNLFVVGLGQEGTREAIKCKNLFNVRIAMKQLEESSIRTVLGCSIPADDRHLKQREFYVVDNNGLRRGTTYDL